MWTLSGKCAEVKIDSLATEEWRWQFSSAVFLTFLSRFSLYHTPLFFCRFLPPLSLPVFAWLSVCPPLRPCCEGRFQVLANNNLQIHQVTKADEGVYRCEASVEARGEIDFVDIAMVVNGESLQPDSALLERETPAIHNCVSIKGGSGAKISKVFVYNISQVQKILYPVRLQPLSL